MYALLETFETVERQRKALDGVAMWREKLQRSLSDPNSPPSETGVIASHLKNSIESCRRLIPDVDPRAFIEIDDREDGEPLEEIRL